MKDDNREAPSPWARRVYAKLRRLVGRRIETLERRDKLQSGPKPWGGKRRKSKPDRS